MDIWNCPGCAATWRNASGAANTALVATGVVVGANGIAMVGGTVATVARPALQAMRAIATDPEFLSFGADAISGWTPASFVPASWGGLFGVITNQFYEWGFEQ